MAEASHASPRPTRKSGSSCCASRSTPSCRSGNTAVYIDAGHSGWLKPAEDAKLLKEAGIDEADGFALNVSNYKSTSTEIPYGKEISKLLGGKHFVIDTSRNGNGPPKCDEAPTTRSAGATRPDAPSARRRRPARPIR